MKNQVDEQMVLLSDYYPGVYTQQFVPEQEEVAKPRRRRRKANKVEGSNGGFRKRKLSDEQVNMLERNFGEEHKLESERKDRLASELGLDPRQVAVWFQNRRARWKNKKLEEEYSKLKNELDTTLLHKCRLETEVLKLKEQLNDADKEIHKLLDGGISSNSPTSSFSMETMQQPPFLGEFGMEGLENVLYLPQHNYDIHGLDWLNI